MNTENNKWFVGQVVVYKSSKYIIREISDQNGEFSYLIEEKNKSVLYPEAPSWREAESLKELEPEFKVGDEVVAAGPAHIADTIKGVRKTKAGEFEYLMTQCPDWQAGDCYTKYTPGCQMGR